MKQEDKIIIITVLAATLIVVAGAGIIFYTKGSKQVEEKRKRSGNVRLAALQRGASKVQAEKEAALSMVDDVAERAKVSKELDKIASGKTEEQAQKAIVDYTKKIEEQNSGVLQTLKSGVSETVSEVKGYAIQSNPVFQKKLDEISKAIGVDKNSILKMMKHESHLDYTIVNSIGCVGLIQFCPDKAGGNTKTINGKVYKFSDLKSNLSLQMDAIKEFWMTGKNSGKIKSPTDLYIYNFFPIAAGKPDDYILQHKTMTAEKIAKANPVFNRKLGRPDATPLSVGDLKKYYKLADMV